LEGTINIKCKLKNLRNQFFIKISVLDTGVGIKEVEKIKIYKDLGNLENECKIINKNSSIGLGLSISKCLIKKLDLKFEFVSEYLKGSKFSIFIPCKRKGSSNYLKSFKIMQINEKKISRKDDSIETLTNKSINEMMSDEKSFYQQDSLLRKSKESLNQMKNKKSSFDIDKSFENKLNKVRVLIINWFI